jgi:transcriptional regulator with XRE-family HTH domain
MKKHSETIDIGANLRKLREDRNLSIRSLSKICGLAVNTLSLIENGKTSPSINTLSKIAKALNIPLTAFFSSGIERNDICYSEKSKAISIEFKSGKYFDLGSQKTSLPIGPFLISILPKANIDIEIISHPGYEFALCLNGILGYFVKDKRYLLECGDSLLFDASNPHCWYNPSDTPTEFLLVHYPIQSTDIARLHQIL